MVVACYLRVWKRALQSHSALPPPQAQRSGVYKYGDKKIDGTQCIWLVTCMSSPRRQVRTSAPKGPTTQANANPSTQSSAALRDRPSRSLACISRCATKKPHACNNLWISELDVLKMHVLEVSLLDIHIVDLSVATSVVIGGVPRGYSARQCDIICKRIVLWG